LTLAVFAFVTTLRLALVAFALLTLRGAARRAFFFAAM
jgi:hypothetical protein